MSTAAELEKLYSKGKSRKVLAILLICFALFATALVAVSLGAGSPRFNEAMNVILNRVFPSLDFDPGTKITQIIILDLRLPRIILSLSLIHI